MFTEGFEGTVPGGPLGEECLDLRRCGVWVGDFGEVLGRVDLGLLSAEPVLEGGKGDADGVSEDVECDAGVLCGEVQDAEPEAVGVATAVLGAGDASGVAQDVSEELLANTDAWVCGRGRCFQPGSPRRLEDIRKAGVDDGPDLVGSGAACTGGFQDPGRQERGEFQVREVGGSGEKEAGAGCGGKVLG